MVWVGLCYEGVAGEFGWVRFLVLCLLHETNPNPRKIICCGKKVVQLPLLTYFSWVGLALGWGSSSVSYQYFHVLQPNTLIGWLVSWSLLVGSLVDSMVACLILGWLIG